ncbi:MAG: GTP 3',8-cyclase MoaA [Bacillota bacterium]
MSKITDSFGRKINYLRVSITDRCNLRCRYCMPPEGVEFKPHSQILSYEEIVKIIKAGNDIGIDRVRITGGEPLVRKGAVELIRMLNNLNTLKDLSMTTNGTLLKQYAFKLKEAGLDRVNISLDTLEPHKYQKITRRDKFDAALEGIDTALEAGLNPVKINVVLIQDFNENEIGDFISLTRTRPLHVRFIEYMPFIDSREGDQIQKYCSLTELKRDLSPQYNLQPASIQGNGPAEYYRLKQGTGTIGFISPVSHKFCASCNRLRLTADGRLKPCLANDIEVNIRNKQGDLGSKQELVEKYKKAISLKPASHHFNEGQSFNRNMYEIGG